MTPQDAAILGDLMAHPLGSDLLGLLRRRYDALCSQTMTASDAAAALPIVLSARGIYNLMTDMESVKARASHA